MSNRNWIIILVIALAGLCALCIGAVLIGALFYFPIQGQTFSQVISGSGDFNVTASSEEIQTFDTPPAILEVINRFGEVSITAVDDISEVQVRMTKEGYGRTQEEAEQALNQIQVAADQTVDRLRLEVTSSDRQENRVDKSVSFDIQVPVETTVLVDSQTGAIRLSGTRGKADLNSEFGQIEITDFAGGLAARTASGAITARRIAPLDSGEGDISLSSDFGAVQLEDARSGDVNVASRSGQVRIENLTSVGAVSLNSDFGEVQWRTGTAEQLEIESRSGQVALSDLVVAGEVQVETTFGEIQLTDVEAAGYDLRSGSGLITVRGANGPLQAESQQSDLNISGGEIDQLTLETASGSVSFRGALGAGPHEIRTTFGNITLNLPQDSAFDYDLNTDRGVIRNDFAAPGTDSSSNRQTGSANGGGDQLTVNSVNGSIELRAIP